MRKGLLADSPPFTQLIMLLFTMVVCFLLLMFIGVLIAPFILGIPISDMMNSLHNGSMVQNLNLMRYFQTLQGISLFIIPAFFAAYLFSENANVINYLCMSQPRTLKLGRWYGAVLLLMLAAIPLINIMAALNEMIVFPQSMTGLEQRLKFLEEAAQQTTELFLNVDHLGGMFFNIFMIAIIPALGEELIFRGVLQKIFTRWTGNIHVAIIVCGLLFSMMHLQFYGFFPRWMLGVMFGYLMVWSGTLWIPIFAHFVNNALAVFCSYLIHKGIISEWVEKFGTNWADIPVTILAIAICAWLIWKIKNK